jgi:transposase-like protein
MAMWFVTSQKYGASALGLKRVLGLGSYQTAWTWLHKLRRAMVRPDQKPLRGIVEVDETYVGGVSRGIRGRGAKGKTAVAIALELHEPKGFGRVRMQRVADCSGPTLTKFVYDNVAPGSVIRTDGWPSYNGISTHGYQHEPTPTKSADPEDTFMPGVHRVASLLKRVLLGTHQGAVAGAHLDYYLDEFTFRFNRRASGSRGLLFYRLAEQAVCTPPTSYRGMVGGADLRAKPPTSTGRGSLASSG